MKKLGRPKRGYDGMRPLTRTEAKITGLTCTVFVHTEDTGIVTLWIKAAGGGFSRVYNAINAQNKFDGILSDFWSQK